MKLDTAIRTSPLQAQLAALEPQWRVVEGMQTAVRLPGDAAARMETVALADLSCLSRTGLKGAGAAQWLERQGIAVPAQANAWSALPGGGVIARLGRTEFFLEDAAGGDSVARVRTALWSGTTDVVPVIRQDAAIALLGRDLNALLVQCCNFNFAEVGPRDRTAVMTLMVGVSVLALRSDYRDLPGFRIWCDPTFAPYLWETLAGIAAELGGGVIGAEALLA
jgi:sarcosine oxidase, subunit gamma